jgi:3-oxoacyl-[acyl-carrier-protein] synthase-3
MAQTAVSGIQIAGVASAVPATLWNNSETVAAFGEDEVKRISRSAGIVKRHVSNGSLCTTDLCYAAAKKLLENLSWDPESVNLLVLVSQTNDYCIPASSCVMHQRLGLSSRCAAFDLGMGCSGYVYGLWVVSSMLAATGMKRGLLLVGDTIPRLTSPLDRSTALLFGDAGTATALQRDENTGSINFSLGTDGKGWPNLLIPASGCRIPKSTQTSVQNKAEGNNSRSLENVCMNGAEIFAFTIAEVPPLVGGLLETRGWQAVDVDYFVFHQANKFMLTHLATKMGLPMTKLPLSLSDYGNTSCASIPVTLTTMRESLQTAPRKLLMAGFGVGYSWAGCTLESAPMVCPEMLFVDELSKY